MTIHVSKKTLKNFKEWYMVGIHQLKQYVVSIREQKQTSCSKWNGINSNLYMAGIQKSLKKIQNQNLRYAKQNTKILVYEQYTSQKKLYEVIYRPFFAVLLQMQM